MRQTKESAAEADDSAEACVRPNAFDKYIEVQEKAGTVASTTSFHDYNCRDGKVPVYSKYKLKPVFPLSAPTSDGSLATSGAGCPMA
eukprot:SAG31_NODE_6213_length_2118_cov_3.319960_2_plen_86_part_01